MTTSPIRVFQVATGNVGTEMIKRLQHRPDLELVGLHCYTPEKVGRDAGEIAGIGPIGVTATGTVEEIIAARPDVLVLDDPLSALDVRTEEAVTGRLREVLAGTTTLIVAHRPSTVALADRVAVLQDGAIHDVGTHAELLARSAVYRDIISNAEAEEARA